MNTNKNNNKDNGFTSILYAIGTKPLQNWDFSVKNGHIKRLLDPDIQSPSIEIIGANVDSNYIFTPHDPKKSLGIKMHTIVLLVKNLQKYFEFSVNIIDDKKIERTFKASNFQTLTRVKGNFCSLPMKLEDGWNQVHICLDDFCKKAFGTNYKETKRVQIHANCRIRRIYFTEFPVNYRKIPPEYKVFAAVEEDTTDKSPKEVIEEDQENA
jgi:hypothetical protein